MQIEQSKIDMLQAHLENLRALMAIETDAEMVNVYRYKISEAELIMQMLGIAKAGER